MLRCCQNYTANLHKTKNLKGTKLRVSLYLFPLPIYFSNCSLICGDKGMGTNVQLCLSA